MLATRAEIEIQPQSVPPRPAEPRLPFILAVGTLAGLLNLVAITWLYTWSNGHISIPGVELRGGPWNHNSEMTTFVDFICLAGTLSAALAIACVVTTRNLRHRTLAVASLLASLIVVVYHAMLID